MAPALYIHQQILSPHMAGLVAATAATGREVVYVANMAMYADRAGQGWQVPDLGAARIEIAATPEALQGVVARAPADSVHICEGIRGNRLVGVTQAALRARGLREWTTMEMLDDQGAMGLLRRLEYRRLFATRARGLEGVLAIGHPTPDWIRARGVPAAKIYPFLYFLPDRAPPVAVDPAPGPFRLLFAGQVIARKRLDTLIAALALLPAEVDLRLSVLGEGDLLPELRARAEAGAPGRVEWLGQVAMAEVPPHMAAADCLVLPSRHDGFGAVVSEALMAGTPAIASHRCGASGIVMASGEGGVFPMGDARALADLLARTVARGRVSGARRARLAAWAKSLAGAAGADYLARILAHSEGRGPRPTPPWLAAAPGGETAGPKDTDPDAAGTGTMTGALAGPANGPAAPPARPRTAIEGDSDASAASGAATAASGPGISGTGISGTGASGTAGAGADASAAGGAAQ